MALLPILLGGAKELGIVYINIIRGAKEPRNLQNHRGAYTIPADVPPYLSRVNPFQGNNGSTLVKQCSAMLTVHGDDQYRRTVDTNCMVPASLYVPNVGFLQYLKLT